MLASRDMKFFESEIIIDAFRQGKHTSKLMSLKAIDHVILAKTFDEIPCNGNNANQSVLGQKAIKLTQLGNETTPQVYL